MTMTRRIELLIAAVLLLALLGSLAIHTLTARQALQWQLELRNRDAASALALALSQQHGDAAALQTVAAAQFDLGHYRRLHLQAVDGQVLVDLKAAASAGRAPAWFAQAWPIAAPMGTAIVSDGWREIGRLQIESHAAWARDALWDAVTRTALLLTLLVLAAGVTAARLLRLWRRPLRATVAQAQALEQGRFVEADEPTLPELRQLTRSMNATVRRLRAVFDAQAEQVARLQRQAQQDAVTGLLLRAHFLTRLQDQLGAVGGGAPPAAGGSAGTALVLVRVLELQGANDRLGRDATDRVLRAVADVLLTYVERVPGALAGRLNGSDFGLVLPVPGLAAETAGSIHAALDAAPALRAGGVSFAVGAADGLVGTGVGAALAQADAALARAEASDGLAASGSDGLAADPAGARAWRDQIAAALAGARARLGEFPVLDRDGGLIHLECPLRVQVDPRGEFLAAKRWLPLARRGRLMPQVDLAALGLALQAIARDGHPRAVHIAFASLAKPGFAAEVGRLLRDSHGMAEKLSLECAEPARPAELRAWADAAPLWRRQGVRLGVEHAGASPQQLLRLQHAGIHYVKVDARHLRGVAGNEAVHAYAQSLVALLHGLGLLALAEGVDDAGHLAALWALGFDGATGPAVTLPG
jgi:EAL domain-containing protein (putative c-di-GMP-specific phosphodiesterase class I)/GGDEF domain-containing protein